MIFHYLVVTLLFSLLRVVLSFQGLMQMLMCLRGKAKAYSTLSNIYFKNLKLQDLFIKLFLPLVLYLCFDLRSPIGSVADLSTCVQSDAEEPDKQVIKIRGNICISFKILFLFFFQAGSDTETVHSNSETTNSNEAKTECADCDVGILVTSPGGTSVNPEATSKANGVEENQVSDQAAGQENVEKVHSEEVNEKQDQSEFVNAQGYLLCLKNSLNRASFSFLEAAFCTFYLMHGNQ